VLFVHANRFKRFRILLLGILIFLIVLFLMTFQPNALRDSLPETITLPALPTADFRFLRQVDLGEVTERLDKISTRLDIIEKILKRTLMSDHVSTPVVTEEVILESHAAPVVLDQLVTASGMCSGVRLHEGFDAFSHLEISPGPDSDIAILKWGPGLFFATLPSTDATSRFIQKYKLYRPLETMMILGMFANARKSSPPMPVTLIEISNNLGYMAIMAAGYGNRGVVINAIPVSVDAVCRSVVVNHLERSITVVPKVLYSEDGKDLFVGYLDTNVASARLLPDSPTDMESFPVTTVALDTIYRDLDIPDSSLVIVYINVEGWEINILQGAREVLSLKNVGAIFFSNNMGYPPAVDVRLAMLREIHELGFRILVCDFKSSDRCTDLHIDDGLIVGEQGTDIVAVRQEFVSVISNFDCFGKDSSYCSK